MSKRNVDQLLADEPKARKQVKFDDNVKKHTLDSDEEDDDKDKYNVLDSNDIEGEEDAPVGRQDGEIPLTAFNMSEELELGYFDHSGHFIWKVEKDVHDNWLHNVDWQNVRIAKNGAAGEDAEVKGLGDESDDEEEKSVHFDHIVSYRNLLRFLKPGETVNKALKRLGGDVAKLSSIERLRRKKAGTLGNSKAVVELTELANGILTHLGNMDVYQETFEQIQVILNRHDKKNKSKAHIVEAELDMYSDDFDAKEQSRLVESSVPSTTTSGRSESDNPAGGELLWEFKWNQAKSEVEGPFDTEQMNKWAGEGYFKTGVWVRKCGDSDSSFYSSNRIDFELYL